MTRAQLAQYADVLEEAVLGAAAGVGAMYRRAEWDRDDLVQEAWQAFLHLELPATVRNPLAFFGVVAKRRMQDWCRSQQCYDARTRLLESSEWDGMSEDEPPYTIRGTQPQCRDHYNARRHHLEDYYYI